MAYMPTNFRMEIQYIHTLQVLLALLNTLFTIHSKLPALKFCGDPFLATSTLYHIAQYLLRSIYVFSLNISSDALQI